MKLTKSTLKTLIKEMMSSKSMILEEPVVEATMSSIKDKIDPNSARPDRTVGDFMVMSSDRGERSASENMQMYKELKQQVKLAGYPFTELVGSWVETDAETGEQVRVTENSIVAFDEKREDVPVKSTDLFELGRILSQKYDQEAFIFGEMIKTKTGQRRVINAFDANGKELGWGGPWKSLDAVSKDENFWSRVRRGGGGETFQFKEEIIEVEAPDSVIEAYKRASEHPGKKIKFVRRNK